MAMCLALERQAFVLPWSGGPHRTAGHSSRAGECEFLARRPKVDGRHGQISLTSGREGQGQERRRPDRGFPIMANLKVFRTPAGFHDAYVAAPSQKAALKAWGSEADLFARGIAEKVTDPKLMEKPLAKPGVVIKVSRGSAGDHFEAAETRSPPDRGRRNTRRAAKEDQAEATVAPVSRKPKKTNPRPSRAKRDAAGKAVDQASANLKAGLADIDARMRALDAERRTLQAEGDKRVTKLEADRDRARREYQARLEKWARS